jgi:carbon monoxide dehydrogenase subunit G
MIKITASVCIDAPVEAAWAVLSDLERISLWVPAIRRAHCPGTTRGAGSVRVCELDQATIRESFVAWDEGTSFTYHGEGAPMMESALNMWSVEKCGEQCLVITRAEAELKGGAFGRLLEPLAMLAFRLMAKRSLAALKYLVEHGTPYPGNVRELGPAPAAC